MSNKHSPITRRRAGTGNIAGRRISNGKPTAVERDELKERLNDARDEAPLQLYLAQHPRLFLRMLPPGSDIYIYDRPKLGSEYIPDFLISVRNSQGLQWTCIELESPTKKALTKSGVMTAKLSQAVGQISDWKDWLRDNIAYAQAELGLKEISNELEAWIIIGRRANMSEAQRKRYASLNRLGFTVL